jgi:hypothetical protein
LRSTVAGLDIHMRSICLLMSVSDFDRAWHRIVACVGLRCAQTLLAESNHRHEERPTIARTHRSDQAREAIRPIMNDKATTPVVTQEQP